MAETRSDRIADQLATLRSQVQTAAFDCEEVARQPVCSVGEATAWRSMAVRLRKMVEKGEQHEV